MWTLFPFRVKLANVHPSPSFHFISTLLSWADLPVAWIKVTSAHLGNFLPRQHEVAQAPLMLYFSVLLVIRVLRTVAKLHLCWLLNWRMGTMVAQSRSVDKVHPHLCHSDLKTNQDSLFTRLSTINQAVTESPPGDSVASLSKRWEQPSCVCAPTSVLASAEAAVKPRGWPHL